MGRAAFLLSLLPALALADSTESAPRPPIGDPEFKQLILAVEATRIYKDKVSLVRLAAEKNWFQATQVGRLLDLTPISQDKLEMLRDLQSRIVDPENSFLIYNHLKLEGDKRKARGILEAPARLP